MLVFKTTLTGRRNVKANNSEYVVGNSTNGIFSFPPLVAEKVGLTDGGSIIITENEGIVYIAAGKTYTPKRDENGKIIRDDRKRIVTEDDGIGSVVRQKSEGSPFLMASSVSAWDTLGCSSEGNTDFKLGEGIESALMIDPSGDEEDTNNLFVATFYPLEKVGFRPKAVRGEKSAEAEDEADREVDASEFETEVNDTTVQNYPTTNDSGFESEEV